jgi:hypothetical protein
MAVRVLELELERDEVEDLYGYPLEAAAWPEYGSTLGLDQGWAA